MVYKTVYTEVEVDVDVDLDEFDTDDLIDELKDRGVLPEVFNTDNPIQESISEHATKVFQKIRCGEVFDKELSDLIYAATGRII